MLGPNRCSTTHDFWAIADNSVAESFPAPGMFRSMMYFGIVIVPGLYLDSCILELGYMDGVKPGLWREASLLGPIVQARLAGVTGAGEGRPWLSAERCSVW